MQSLKLSPYASNWLNFLRWFSALLVVAGHLRSIIFVKWQDVAHKTIWAEILYFFTRFGHEAVVVFFVITNAIRLERLSTVPMNFESLGSAANLCLENRSPSKRSLVHWMRCGSKVS